MASKRKREEYKLSSRYRRVRALLDAGFTVEQIKDECSFPIDGLVEQIKKDDIDKEKRKATMLQRENLGVAYGTKNDYYYHPMDYPDDVLINTPPKYSYMDLSKDEKKMYQESEFKDGEWKQKHITMQLWKCGFYKEDESVIMERNRQRFYD